MMSLQQGTVFIVDDDPSFLKSISRLLQAVGRKPYCTALLVAPMVEALKEA